MYYLWTIFKAHGSKTYPKSLPGNNSQQFFIEFIAKELTGGCSHLRTKTIKMPAIHVTMPEYYTTRVSITKHEAMKLNSF